MWQNSRVEHTPTRGPGRPPAAKAAETRKRIVRAARQVFSERGYDAATFQAIALRADLTRPAINHYFASKQVLYRAVMEQTEALVVAAAIERARAETTMVARISAFIAATTQADSENRSAVAFLITSVLESQRHPELSRVENNSLRKAREFLTSAVNDAIQQGELSADTDIPALTAMLLAVLCGVGFYAGFVGSMQEIDAISGQLHRLLVGVLWRSE